MPLDKVELINENIHLSVWEITEDEATLAAMVKLSESDKELLEGIHHEQKRIEFLAGRLLVQQTFKTLEIPFHRMFRNSYGKPELFNSKYQISLSHTTEYVVLLIGLDTNVGVDIEMPQEKMLKVALRLFSDSEREICGNDMHQVSKFWSAKEVLYKLYMKGDIDFKLHLKIDQVAKDFSSCEARILKDGTSYAYHLCFRELGKYYICYNVN